MFCSPSAQNDGAAKFPTPDRRIAQPKFEPGTLRTLSALPPHRCVCLQKLSGVGLYCCFWPFIRLFNLLLFSAVYQTSLYCCSLPFIILHSLLFSAVYQISLYLLFSVVYQTSLDCCSLPFKRSLAFLGYLSPNQGFGSGSFKAL